MNDRPTLESWNSPPGSWKTFLSPSNSDMCVCIPEPGYSVNGFGMNVA